MTYEEWLHREEAIEREQQRREKRIENCGEFRDVLDIDEKSMQTIKQAPGIGADGQEPDFSLRSGRSRKEA